MDVSRYGVDTVRAAKRELLQHGILEPVEGEGPWRRHTPRYRINEQKLQRDEAAWARQTTRRARREKGRAAADPEPEKGREISDLFPGKGREIPQPFGEKGREIPPPEVFRKTKNPRFPRIQW